MAAYPTSADALTWIGAPAGSDAATLLPDIVDAVTDYWLDMIPTSALAAAARPGGASPDCPARLRMAIIMHAARVLGRRSSRGGFEVTGDVTSYIRNVDPDIQAMTAGLTNWPEA